MTRIDDVPTDVFQQCICPWLTPRELLQCAAVSRTWRSQARANHAWRAHKDRLVRYLPELQVVFDAHYMGIYWYVYAKWLISTNNFGENLIGSSRCVTTSILNVAFTKTYFRLAFRLGVIREIIQDSCDAARFSVVFCTKDLRYTNEWLRLEFHGGVGLHPQTSRGYHATTTYGGSFIPHSAIIVYSEFREYSRQNAFFNRSARDTAPLPPPMYEFAERYSALNVDATP